MKMILYIVGIIAVLSGVIGFFGDSTVLGLYDASTVQNIIHIVLGLALLMSVKKGKAKLTKIVGIVFAIVGILGFVMSGDTVLGIAVDSTATNSLHLLLGVVVLLIAFMNKSGSYRSSIQSEGADTHQTPQQPQQPETPQQPNNPQM